jgi:hypothetical protein
VHHGGRSVYGMTRFCWRGVGAASADPIDVWHAYRCVVLGYVTVQSTLHNRFIYSAQGTAWSPSGLRNCLIPVL